MSTEKQANNHVEIESKKPKYSGINGNEIMCVCVIIRSYSLDNDI